jgi:hypothetical protein
MRDINWTTQSANDRVAEAHHKLESTAARDRLSMLRLEIHRAEDRFRRLSSGVKDDESRSSSSSSSSFSDGGERKRRKLLQLQDERKDRLAQERGRKMSLIAEMATLQRFCSAFTRPSKEAAPEVASRTSKESTIHHPKMMNR